jgi:hypothetical protein
MLRPPVSAGVGAQSHTSLMQTFLSRARTSALALLIAVALTLLSSHVERLGPEMASYGNLCGPSSDQDCLEPVLNAGLPWAYLFDQPGVSVERKLFFVEDTLRPVPFALNVVVYFFFVSLLGLAARRVRHAMSRGSARGDA